MADLVTRPLGLGSVTEMEKEWHTAEEIRQIASQAAEHGALAPGHARAPLGCRHE